MKCHRISNQPMDFCHHRHGPARQGASAAPGNTLPVPVMIH